MTVHDQLKEMISKLADTEDVAQKYALHLTELFEVIDAEKISEAYKKAIESGDYPRAATELAQYYRQKPRNKVSNLSANGTYNKSDADRTVEGYVKICDVEWKFENGDFDFLFNATEDNGPINHEWLWQLGRHNYWVNLARSYVATQDEKYALAFEKQLLKWIAQSYIPEKWNAPRSTWRTIECGIRLLGSWQTAFDGFIRSAAISDVTMLLMIASMLRQTLHLLANPTKGNWLMMEMNGVYTFSSLFEELRCAVENRRVATEYLIRELSLQMLPDGMHDELSPDYHSVVFGCAANFYSVASALGRKDEIPDEFTKLIKNAVNAALDLTTPARILPLTNDTHNISTSLFVNRAERLFGPRPDWTFINSQGKSGTAPGTETASRFLAYAGFAVMRGDWSADSAYLCFDVGPLGTSSHAHQDKLNIIVYKGDRELIFDDGGGHYDKSEIRQFSKSGHAHNTVLVDSMAQNRIKFGQSSEPIDASWISNIEFDYACGVYDDAFGDELLFPATHKREVRFCKPDFFCVTDTLTSRDGKTHDYEILFQIDTESVVSLDGYENGMISNFGSGYEIAVIPVDPDGIDTSAKRVSGQEKPFFRGWYNGRNETELHKATTLSREVKGVKDHRFTTLLFPLANGQELPKIKRLAHDRVQIIFNSKEYILNLSELDK